MQRICLLCSQESGLLSHGCRARAAVSPQDASPRAPPSFVLRLIGDISLMEFSSTSYIQQVYNILADCWRLDQSKMMVAESVLCGLDHRKDTQTLSGFIKSRQPATKLEGILRGIQALKCNANPKCP